MSEHTYSRIVQLVILLLLVLGLLYAEPFASVSSRTAAASLHYNHIERFLT